jgi:hypothetical protein
MDMGPSIITHRVIDNMLTESYGVYRKAQVDRKRRMVHVAPHILSCGTVTGWTVIIDTRPMPIFCKLSLKASVQPYQTRQDLALRFQAQGAPVPRALSQQAPVPWAQRR